MRILDPAVRDARAARGYTHVEVLIWITARSYATGLKESIGIWTGPDHEAITVSGQLRTYYGGGNVQDLDPLVTSVGLDVRSYTVRLSGISPEVQLAARGYDLARAAIEVHQADYDFYGHMIGGPMRRFKGWVDASPITTPPKGGNASVSLECVSNSRMLTRYGTGVKSHETQKLRSGDQFRKYASVVNAKWEFGPGDDT